MGHVLTSSRLLVSNRFPSPHRRQSGSTSWGKLCPIHDKSGAEHCPPHQGAPSESGQRPDSGRKVSASLVAAAGVHCWGPSGTLENTPILASQHKAEHCPSPEQMDQVGVHCEGTGSRDHVAICYDSEIKLGSCQETEA